MERRLAICLVDWCRQQPDRLNTSIPLILLLYKLGRKYAGVEHFLADLMALTFMLDSHSSIQTLIKQLFGTGTNGGIQMELRQQNKIYNIRWCVMDL